MHVWALIILGLASSSGKVANDNLAKCGALPEPRSAESDRKGTATRCFLTLRVHDLRQGDCAWLSCFPTTIQLQSDMPYLSNDTTTFHDFLQRRDFQTQVTPNETQRTTLIVAGVYILVIAILWCVSTPERFLTAALTNGFVGMYQY